MAIMERQAANMRKTNTISIYEDYAEIILTGRHRGSCIIDLCDYERVSQHCWVNKQNSVAQARIDGTIVSLPRFIMNAQKGERVITNRTKPFDYRQCNLLLVR